MPRIGVRGFSGAALDRALARRRINAEELADAIGMSHQAVSTWRRGAASPTPEALKKMDGRRRIPAVVHPARHDLTARAGAVGTGGIMAYRV
jgi:transcriptional regulator with XRE-family HTH domain